MNYWELLISFIDPEIQSKIVIESMVRVFSHNLEELAKLKITISSKTTHFIQINFWLISNY